MATIRKRGPYQWQAIVKRQGFPLTSKTFETRGDAQVWARTIESEMDRGMFLPRNDSEKTMLRDLLARYEEDVLPTKRGKHFAPALRILGDRLGRYSVAALTPKAIADFRDSRLRAGLSASTVRKEVNLLSKVIDLAGKEWGVALPSNPCAMVTRPSEQSARTRRLAANEEKYLLAACAPLMANLITLAIETAARLGELLSLQWRDVDLKKRVAIIRGIDGRGTKNNDAFRAVPLSSKARDVLKHLPKENEFIFPNWKAADSFNKSWTRALARARETYIADCQEKGKKPESDFLSDLRFHDLRHEATSRLFERGVFDSMEVASITGHKTLAMLKRYTHLRAENLANKLG
jgi:integrase